MKIIFSVYFIPVCIILGFIADGECINIASNSGLPGPRVVMMAAAMEIFFNFFLYVVYGAIYMYGICQYAKLSVILSLPVLVLLILGVELISGWAVVFGGNLLSEVEYKLLNLGMQSGVYSFLQLIGFSLGIVIGAVIIQWMHWAHPGSTPP